MSFIALYPDGLDVVMLALLWSASFLHIRVVGRRRGEVSHNTSRCYLWRDITGMGSGPNMTNEVIRQQIAD